MRVTIIDRKKPLSKSLAKVTIFFTQDRPNYYKCLICKSDHSEYSPPKILCFTPDTIKDRRRLMKAKVTSLKGARTHCPIFISRNVCPTCITTYSLAPTEEFEETILNACEQFVTPTEERPYRIYI